MMSRADAAFAACVGLLRRADPQANALLAELLTRFPDHAAGWVQLGDVLAKTAKHEAALVCFDRAFAAAPHAALAIRRGLLLRELGRAADARAAFADAVRLDPSAPRAHFLLGLCAQDGRDYPAACAAYRAALAVDPALAEASVNLGTVLQEIGDLTGAKRAYRDALKHRPDAFGRIAQALTTAPHGELWLDLAALRAHLAG